MESTSNATMLEPKNNFDSDKKTIVESKSEPYLFESVSSYLEPVDFNPKQASLCYIIKRQPCYFVKQVEVSSMVNNVEGFMHDFGDSSCYPSSGEMHTTGDPLNPPGIMFQLSSDQFSDNMIMQQQQRVINSRQSPPPPLPSSEGAQMGHVSDFGLNGELTPLMAQQLTQTPNDQPSSEPAKKKRRKNPGKKHSSQYRGVYKKVSTSDGKGDKWAAQIHRNSKPFYLGSFSTEKEAAKAYDRAARQQHGVNASCNFVLSAEELEVEQSTENTEPQRRRPSSKFRGVYAKGDRWAAQIHHSGKVVSNLFRS